jgi:hypothetical protein
MSHGIIFFITILLTISVLITIGIYQDASATTTNLKAQHDQKASDDQKASENAKDLIISVPLNSHYAEPLVKSNNPSNDDDISVITKEIPFP